MPNLSSIKLFFYAAIAMLSIAGGAAAQTQFRVGERITYSVSFDKFSDVAYGEIYTVSRGALSGKDAIELRMKMKTLNPVGTGFFELDEVRTAFVDAATGTPLYVSRVENPTGLPKETTADYQKSPSANLDLVSLIYKIRHMAGGGAANLQDGDKIHGVTFQPAGSEKIRVTAGEFDTTVVTVQSEYFTELGFREVKINLTNDEARVPVLVRMARDKKRVLRAEAASIQSIVPEPAASPTPTPTATPVPRITPAPTATPDPYIDNQPLAPELAFALGETLEYRVTAGERPVGTFVTRARERKQVGGNDTLILTATVTNAAQGNPVFNLNDSITVNVDPITLAPRKMDIRMFGGLASLSQPVTFDERTGAITFKGNNRVEAPVATHSLLSLIYAMRSFNLKPSAVRTNPVNDTRVAVFWDSQPYVFTLRPSAAAEITVNGQKRQAQQINVNTGNPQLDQLAIKIWLSNDAGRVPLRFSAGPYQADLVSVSNTLSRP